MKILVCHNRYRQRSGEDVVFDEMLEILENRGHALVRYIDSNARIDGPFRLAGSLFSLRVYRELRGLVGRERPQIAIVQNVFPLLSPSVYWALRREGVPVLQNVFNYRLACPSGTFFSRGRVCERCIRGNYFNGVVRRCFRDSFALSAVYALVLAFHRFLGTFHRGVDRYIVPDRFFETKLVAAGFSARKFRRVCNPFKDAEGAVSQRDDGYILFVGRLVREKGVITLLEAARRVPEVPLHIVGDGPLGAHVRGKAQQAVRFLGPVYGERLDELIAGARALVVPSEWYDNGPVVVYQAFARGKPVIASDIDGLPELVVPGQTGWLFPPGDRAALAALLRHVSNSPEEARRLGVRAHAWLHGNAGADRYGRALESVFRELAEAGLSESALKASRTTS